jgi:hypothetical protein
MSDIFVKTTTTTGWRKASNIFVKTTTTTGWKAAVAIWIRNATQWLRVWPLSGIFATRVPYIGYFSSDTYDNRMPNATYPLVRIGDSYFGDNSRWDLNGWVASSYTFRWKLYDQFGQELGITLRSGTGSGWTTTTGEDQLPTSIWTATNSTNADRQYLGFEVTANNSSNSQYNGLSASAKIQVVRETPRIATGGSPSFNVVNVRVGDTLNYSASWDTAQAYKIETARTTILWYKSTLNNLTESQLRALTPIQTSGYSYIVQPLDNNNYIYAMEEVYNSGTDLTSLVNGVTAIAKTNSLVATAPSNFTYSLTNVSSVTTPSAPIQQRVSATSNTVLIEMASSFPSNTQSYNLWSYGTGSSSGGTLANPAVQSITTLNQYNSSGNFLGAGSSFDTITSISSSALNSPISTFTEAIGTTRTLQFNVNTTSGASSWAINYTVSGASSGNGTLILNTNSMPATITISGASNPTVSINSITAYAEINQQGVSTGIGGIVASLASVPKPSAFSTTSSSNYTFYVTPVIPTISIAANSGVSATAGTINWTSTNQASFSSTGTFSGTGTTATSITKTGLTASTTYTGTVTVTSSTGHTASANYSLTTSAPPTWTITWNANGGTGGGTTVQNQGVSHTAPSPGTRDGFDFVNYRKPEFGGDPTFVASGGTFNPSANDAFWAQWTAKTYAVTFDANGGTGAPASQVKTHGVTLTLSSTAPTRATVSGTSYTFAGWNTAANGTGTSYAAGASYTLNAALSLFAQWTATTLTWSIEWRPNGGTGGGTTVQNRGVAHTAPSPGTRTGYTFTNYRKPEFAGDPTFVASGGTFNPSANDVFWAQWTNNSSAGSVTLTSTNTAGAGGRFNFSNTTATGVTGTLTYYWTLGTAANPTIHNSLTANTTGSVTTGRITPLVFRVYSQFTGQDGVTYTSATAQISVTFT